VRIGREIRRRRQAIGWTLEDLAHRSGLSPRYISTLENDKRDPSLSTIEAVAKALGAEPGELLGLKGVPPGVLEGARLLHALPVEAQELVVRLVRLLSRRRR
jgi:transcriptional regulator with XRE-family HTH domain